MEKRILGASFVMIHSLNQVIQNINEFKQEKSHLNVSTIVNHLINLLIFDYKKEFTLVKKHSNVCSAINHSLNEEVLVERH